MTTPELLPPPEQKKATPWQQVQIGRHGAQAWWRRTSGNASRRWRGLPRWGRVLFMLGFIGFLYVLAVPGFYLNLGIPLPNGNYLPLYTERADMAAVSYTHLRAHET